MNTPALLLAAAIALWGWQTGQWLAAIPAALFLEGARLVRRRWSFATGDFSRVADLCTVLALGAGVVFYVQFGNPLAIKLWFQWLPVLMTPLAAMQAYSDTRDMDLAVLFWSLRRRPLRRPVRLNLAYPYFALWLLGASAANSRSNEFYFALVALAAWALWQLRPRSSPALAWVALLAVAASGGYAGHRGLASLQQWLEGNIPEWLVRGSGRTDPYESRTDLGRLGELKLSGRILMRVTPGAPLAQPLRLHRASYNDYLGITWIARGAAFEPLTQSGSPTDWELVPGASARLRIAIDEESSQGNPVLSLPPGAVRITHLAAVDMKRNPLGAVQIEIAPGRFRYEVEYDDAQGWEAPPGPVDLGLPRAEEAVLHRIARELQIEGAPAGESVAALERFFAGGFRYATYQPEKPAEGTALAHFLLRSRAGHCEYFATATVLLARAAGIPARYATGFPVLEYNAREGSYIVRQRHAHAWARIFVDGRWRDLDTTPPDWFAMEAALDPGWTAAADLWSWLSFRANRAAASIDRGAMTGASIALAIALVLWLAWRLLRRDGLSRSNAAAAARAAVRGGPGADSEFYGIERRLAELGYTRPRAEALAEWIERVGRARLAEAEIADARAALRLHYRYRFDPEGLSTGDRAQLRSLCQRVLAAIDAADRVSAPAPSPATR